MTFQAKLVYLYMRYEDSYIVLLQLTVMVLQSDLANTFLFVLLIRLTSSSCPLAIGEFRL